MAEGELATTLDLIEGLAEDARYTQFSRELIPRVFRLGRILVALFLCLAAEYTPAPLHQKRGRKKFRRQPAKPRLLGTFFGKVRYWRPYVHQLTGRGGFFPLDLELSSGAIEGAVSYVISQRFDEGGMRWIRNPWGLSVCLSRLVSLVAMSRRTRDMVSVSTDAV